jgi:hypothetical protein
LVFVTDAEIRNEVQQLLRRDRIRSDITSPKDPEAGA